MARRWEPREVLDVHPTSCGFTCVGTTKRGARCRNSFISGADRSEAFEILEAISLRRPKSRNLIAELTDLAYLTLCPRWHRKPGYSQVDSMVFKWQRSIDDYCASVSVPRISTVSRPRATVAPTAGPPSPLLAIENDPTLTAASPSSRAAPSTETTRPNLNGTAEAGRRATSTVQTSQQRTEESASMPEEEHHGSRTDSESDRRSGSRENEDVHAPSTPPSRQSSESAPLPTPVSTPRPRHRSSAPSPTIQTPTSSAIHTPISPATTTSADDPSPPALLTPPTSPTPNINTQPTSTPRTVTRKPLTEPCSICTEPISTPDDAVWCRAQCGQNVHRACFKLWRTQSLRNADDRQVYGAGVEESEQRLNAVKCVYCRTRWRWEWED